MGEGERCIFRKKEGSSRGAARLTVPLFQETLLKKGCTPFRRLTAVTAAVVGSEMTGRSIFFSRVCSLRLFPLFPFPTAARNNGERALALSRTARENIPAGCKKALAGPAANINSAV